MNSKWFPRACLALMLIAVGFLFHANLRLYSANQERDKALADMRDAQQQLHDAQAELDTLKSSSAGQQAGLIANLRKQNEALNARVSVLQSNVAQLNAESQQTAEHLTTARTALQLQQQNLQQLQAAQQQATMAANASACINNLHAINAAKQLWALDKQKNNTDVPTAQDLLPYFKDGTFPVCPDGGTYSINALSEAPTCTIPGHVLPP
jgi:hypothetical protein